MWAIPSMVQPCPEIEVFKISKIVVDDIAFMTNVHNIKQRLISERP